MAEPTPPTQPSGHRPPRGLLVLYVLLPVWAAAYLFVAGGLVAPEVSPVARQIPGVSRAPGVAEDPHADQMRAIVEVVPADARDDEPPTEITEAMLADAESQYRALCAVCHGPTGRGDGPAGATLNPPPMSFHSPAFLETPRGVSHWVIRHGLGTTPRRSGMPAFAALSDEQV
ncbi:MAG: cytochrome c, partial [Armatimonadota bacterium]|nr:cytochrome c [Armatimonadota bacterium]